MSLPKDANTAQETLVDFFTKYLDWQMRKIHTRHWLRAIVGI